MKNIINNYLNWITVKKALVITLFFVIMLYLIDFSPIGTAQLVKITNGGQILDMEHGYSVEKAYGVFDYLGEAGREFYLKKIIPLDIFFPISFMFFNLSWMALLLKFATKEDNLLRFLIALPIIDMLCDWLENIGFTVMLINYPVKLPIVCNIGSFITHCKLTSILFIIITDVMLLAGGIIIKIIRKNH